MRCVCCGNRLCLCDVCRAAGTVDVFGMCLVCSATAERELRERADYIEFCVRALGEERAQEQTP